MATTNFIDTVTPIVADWMNDADAVIYDALGDAFHNAPTTKAQVRVNLGLNTSGTNILKGNGTGGFASAVAGTDYLIPPAFTGVAAGSGGGALVAATGAQVVSTIGVTPVTNATNAVNLTGTSVSNIKTSALGLNSADSTKVLYGDRTWRVLPPAGVTSFNGLTGAVVFSTSMLPDYIAGEAMEIPEQYLLIDITGVTTPKVITERDWDAVIGGGSYTYPAIAVDPTVTFYPQTPTIVLPRGGTVRITIDCLGVSYISGTAPGVGLYQNGTLLQDFQFTSPGVQTNDIPVALGDTLYFRAIDGSIGFDRITAAKCYISIGNPLTMCPLKPV